MDNKYITNSPETNNNKFTTLQINYVSVSRIVVFDSLDSMDPPDSSVHGMLQARILEWVAIPFSMESP